ncbi:CaiB/BaiF CoA transferase family protein [Brevibacillus sp. SYSU BS000544]|uniref:CaiB/BaiF CoA transferase family protein n=1 Tax=Brevibacillus sp. SYSU BS000544 TaxID=3416443 RepID=UPI003CE49D68
MLTGLTVVDFSRYLPGPVCTMRLADKGAEVIKVESYPTGDPGRTLGPKYGDDSTLFISSNRNKQSIAINLRTEQGRDLAFRLAVQADVIVESFRPGVMQHLGLDYERIRAYKPDVIYCSLTGYGQYGTMHQLGGHDLNYQAVSGLLGVTKDSEGRPVLSEIPIADYVGGVYASEQICAALVQKVLKGQGAYLDIASADVLASWMGMHVMLAELGGKVTMNHFLTDLFSYNIYETADGRYVALAALEDKFWQNFCRAVGRLDWEDITERNITRYPEIFDELKALFLMRTQSEWNELGTEVDCCLTAVEELDTWMTSPYITGRNLSFSLESGQTGSLVHIRTSFDHPNDGTHPPKLGEHTWNVLQAKLGVSPEQLKHYADLRIIPKGETT